MVDKTQKASKKSSVEILDFQLEWQVMLRSAWLIGSSAGHFLLREDERLGEGVRQGD